MTKIVPWWGLRELAPRMDLWSIIDTLGGPEAAEVAHASAWAAAGLPLPWVDRLRQCAPPGRWLVPTDSAWPALLTGLAHGPVALQIEGDPRRLGEPTVAIVGARACTSDGRGRARRLASELAQAGVVVVSGLARGIDAEAHVAAEGATIAVLGQGMFAAMPAWQRALRAGVVSAGGLIVSEFDPSTPGSTFSFPIRNRIIAGLSRGVVVVEAAARSGARNTAGHAVRAHRPVWAVPGAPDAPASAGCLDLIEEGAAIFRTAGDILTCLGVDVPAALVALLQAPRTLAELSEATGWTTLRLIDALGGLEVQGRLARLPGARYAWAHVRPR